MANMDRRKFLKRVGTVSGVVILGSYGLIACGQKSEQPAPSGGAQSSGGQSQPSGEQPAAKPKVEVVRIGTLHPLTGGVAFAGNQLVAGIKVAAKKVNDAGGIKSLGGARIELVSADTQGKPDVGTAEAERLIAREKVHALIGSYQSSVTFATTQVAEKHGIVHMIDEGIANDVLGRGFKWSFRVIADAAMSATKTVQYAKDLVQLTGVEIKRIAVLHENTLFGTSMMETITQVAPGQGLEVVEVVGYAPSAADLTTEVSKVLQAKPDAILWSGYLGDGIIGSRAFAQLDGRKVVKAIIGNTHGAFSTDKWVEEVGADVANGFFDNNHRWNPSSPETAYVKAQLAEMNLPLTHDVADSYAAASVLFDSIERAGSVEREAIRDAVTKTNLKLDILPQTQPIQFDEKGQNINAQTVLTEVLDGKILVVHPAAFAEGTAAIDWAAAK